MALIETLVGISTKRPSSPPIDVPDSRAAKQAVYQAALGKVLRGRRLVHEVANLLSINGNEAQRILREIVADGEVMKAISVDGDRPPTIVEIRAALGDAQYPVSTDLIRELEGSGFFANNPGRPAPEPEEDPQRRIRG